MRYLWRKLTAIKGWFLVVPAVGVLAWGAFRLLGRVLFKAPQPGPTLTRYLTREAQEAEAVRINRQREVDREADDRVVSGAREELASAMAGKKVNPTELGIVLFQSVFTEAEDDLKAWLADLIGKKVEEFEAMPATTVLDIVEELIKQEGIRDFFGRALLLAGKPTGKG